jgi:hypothetical protein
MTTYTTLSTIIVWVCVMFTASVVLVALMLWRD